MADATGYSDMLLAGTNARAARTILAPADFTRAFARAHMVGLLAAERAFAEELEKHKANTFKGELDALVKKYEHHPSKMAG
jgi:hypothetical protein